MAADAGPAGGAGRSAGAGLSLPFPWSRHSAGWDAGSRHGRSGRGRELSGEVRRGVVLGEAFKRREARKGGRETQDRAQPSLRPCARHDTRTRSQVRHAVRTSVLTRSESRRGGARRKRGGERAVKHEAAQRAQTPRRRRTTCGPSAVLFTGSRSRSDRRPGRRRAPRFYRGSRTSQRVYTPLNPRRWRSSSQTADWSPHTCRKTHVLGPRTRKDIHVLEPSHAYGNECEGSCVWF